MHHILHISTTCSAYLAHDDNASNCPSIGDHKSDVIARIAPDWPIQNWVHNLYSARLQTTALYTDMANDNIYALFDTLSQQSSSPFHRRPGTTYLYVWQDVAKTNDWCSDGYRWRQNGTCSAKCSNGEQLTKTYFRVC